MCGIGLLGGQACVEDPLPEANSDAGHLFIEVERALAVDWGATIAVFGPLTGDTACVDNEGCRYDHHAVEVKDVGSSAPDVVEVVGFGEESFGGVQGVALELEAHEEGAVELEFRIRLPDELIDDDDDGESDENEQESVSENGVVTDTFSLEARDVASIDLRRDLEDLEAPTPYGNCPGSSLGLYLMDQLSQYRVEVIAEKRDAQGQALRGDGEAPFEIEPEDGASVETSLQRDRYILSPERFGELKLRAELGGATWEAQFEQVSNITDMVKRLYRLNNEGRRAEVVEFLHEGQIYEVEVGPDLSGYPPLCGGAMEGYVESMSPAICDVVGMTMDTGNDVIEVGQMGECTLRATLDGAAAGQGVTRDFIYWVEGQW